ncbi:MAG: hypothetical protein NTZ28_01340, partial [Nitrospirae bacterium]|nr:hypothetical protein [Nitrospirota bacterium]
MSSLIAEFASRRQLPEWWVEAIAIEYGDCREYASGEEIWRFNFSMLDEADLGVILDTRAVVVAGQVFQNVDIDVWRSRLVERLVGAGSAPLARHLEDVVPDGPISEYHFLFAANPIDAWDPKLGFSSHFQVLDDGRLWQWKVAEFKSIAGRKYGKWVSCEPEVDLEKLDLVHDELARLRNPVIQPGDAGHAKFRRQVVDFYHWLDTIRKPVLESLLEVHKRRKNEPREAIPGVTSPPLLSRYDSVVVKDGKYHVDFGLEAILFLACDRRVQRVAEIEETQDAKAESIQVLDEDYGERAAAIVLGAACLEAFTNRIGREACPLLWDRIERTNDLIAKWHILLELRGKSGLLRLDGGL